MAARPRRLSGSFTLVLLASLAAARAQPAAPAAGATPLSNQRTPIPGIFTGGAPKTLDGIPAVAALGVRTFLDLRSDAEVSPEVRAAVEAAGMVYERLPIAGDADLDLESARKLHALVHDPARQPLAVVCASGNRSGALLAVEDFWLHGRPAEEALALGLASGMTRLEPSARLLLGLPPAATPAPTGPAAPPAPAPPVPPR